MSYTLYRNVPKQMSDLCLIVCRDELTPDIKPTSGSHDATGWIKILNSPEKPRYILGEQEEGVNEHGRIALLLSSNWQTSITNMKLNGKHSFYVSKVDGRSNTANLTGITHLHKTIDSWITYGVTSARFEAYMPMQSTRRILFFKPKDYPLDFL